MRATTIAGAVRPEASNFTGPSHTAARARFTRFAWAVLAYNVAVVLWGALVRATGSGAGCGGHWPLCNGEVLPQIAQSATIVEFTHRMMSGAALIAVAALWIWSRRALTRPHPGRFWANLSALFIVTEALIGAALVLLGHVARNESVGRVYSLGTHLVNTFLLLASLALTAWSAPEDPTRAPRLRWDWGAVLSILAIVIVAIAGAITALGDTLFPSRTLAEGIQADFAASANFLIRLRVIHPALAVAAGAFIAILAFSELTAKRTRARRALAAWLLGLLVAELTAGGITVLLRAPLAMQIVHLLLADSVWITLVLFTAERLRAPRANA
jgi:cytochrome c oxidase assembly protein subunit 15